MASSGREEGYREAGWKVKYVPHELIEDYNACYRVVYKGKVASPPAADRLAIPLNEIWVSERLESTRSTHSTTS